MTELQFELGQTYTHSTGKEITIVGTMLSKTYGLCLIGETNNGNFVPIGINEDSIIYWKNSLLINKVQL